MFSKMKSLDFKMRFSFEVNLFYEIIKCFRYTDIGFEAFYLFVICKAKYTNTQINSIYRIDEWMGDFDYL